MKDSSRHFLPGGRRTGQWAYLYAAGLTVFMAALLFFFFVQESKRTLRAALAGMGEGAAALSFGEESGFFEEGFVLSLKAADRIPKDSNIEIRYTLNGDEPTEKSLLYQGGIDLKEAYKEAVKEAERSEDGRREAVAKAIAKAEAEGLEQEKQAAAGTEAGEKDISGTEKSDVSGAKENEISGGEDETLPETNPSIEDGKSAWQEEIWTAASDDGVRPERVKDGIFVIPVRACLIQGEDKSPVQTRTYVIGPGAAQRYQDVFIASIVTDSANLFDYDQGIMVKGSHYQTDVEKGVRPDRAGNFFQQGDDWIKNGHVTLFSGKGDVLLEEDAGFNISGYSSRSLPTRSFRAEASKARGSSGDYFSLDIFSPSSSGTEEAAGGEERPAREVSLFKKIKFRTHGVPTYHIRSVRNQFAKELTDECGFYGLTENRPGVMFLNGEFYTVCDITPSADKEYLCSLFGLNVSKAMEKYSGSDVDVYTKAKILKLFTADLTDPARQKALEQAVDMDNYLFYFALEVLFNNADWPYNNVTIWRYLGEQDPENPYTDGRIRFVLDDMDQILSNNLHGDPTRWSTELVDYLMKDKGATFHHVMECKKYRDTFLTYVDDLLNTCFEPDHACAVLDKLYGSLKREYLLDYGEDFWSEMEHTAQVTKQNVIEKEKLYRADIEKYMGLTERYTVRIEAGEGVCVNWNNDCGISPDKKIQSLNPGQTWTGTYYTGTSFTASASVQEGYRFSGWEIDGVLKDSKAEDEPDAGQGKDPANRDITTILISDALRQKKTDGDEDLAVTVRAVAQPKN